MLMRRYLGFILALLVVAGCRPAMADQSRYEAYEASTDFADGSSARPYIDGTVPRNAIVDDVALRTGRTDVDGGFVTTIPLEITESLVARGQERYTIYCVPCHGVNAEGDGPVVQRGFPTPPNLQSVAMEQLPAGFIFDVITNGFGPMFSYADRIPVEDRWAIVAYLLDLQDRQ